ncbi:dicarboxylate/amino acid:cation symporter [Pseudemcibacter sp.]|uniref:dicarboxylate/amino acid:cation symporter n=1 Tax=Pseudemcibacter sp. TaxID=2943293 RepID=UPI0023179F23|nr:dicarboxylate/amino acid:cation symporter [Emcibacteraceae bacterium]MDA9552944.1 dicarboxylate/amino acid:cation symporter [Emcibacteraceae bacterium]
MSKRHSMLLLYSIIVAVILGAATGWIMGEDAHMFSWMGTLFLNALKMVVVPLIVAAIITGVSSLGDIRKLGKPGGITILFFLSSMLIAATVGMILAGVFVPGGDFHLVAKDAAALNAENATTISDVMLGLISPNIIASAANMELLQLIVFSIIFGAALTVTGEKGRVVSNFFESLNNIMMVMVGWIMYLSPFGIFALVATPIAEAGGGEAVLETFAAVGGYVLTVLSGLVVQAIILFLLLVFIARRGINYLGEISPALLTAFSTSSSSATVPLSMDCAEGAGLKKSPVRFVIPLGSTVNMNGTAVYQGVATIFLAQVYGLEVTFGSYIIISLSTALAAIGSAGIPQGGHIMTLMVFSIVGIPAEGFGLIVGVDWFLDRSRTTLNVWGDLVGAAILDRFMTGDT